MHLLLENNKTKSDIDMKERTLLEQLREFLYWFDYDYDPIGGSAARAGDWIKYLDSKIKEIDNGK